MSSDTLMRRTLLAGLAALAPARAFAAPATRPRVRVHTSRGDFTLELEAGKAPVTWANFLRYVDAGKYDGGDFFRATHPPGLPDDGTLVGEMNRRARPFPAIAHESTRQTGLRHVAGTISLGRFAPGTATSDFFICVGPQLGYDANPRAKGDNLGFAAFGHVAAGMDVVRRIHRLPADGRSPYAEQKGQWLREPVTIVSMKRA